MSEASSEIEQRQGRERSRPEERFRPEHRVRHRRDYLGCYRQGRREHGSAATLHYRRNGLADARLGITASRKVGNSVVRHGLKRRVREIFRRYVRRQDLSGYDLVVHLKPTAATVIYAALERDLERLFSRVLRRGSRF